MNVEVIGEYGYEQWRKFPLNTCYEVSNLGRIKNLDGSIRKVTKTKDGYLKTNLSVENKTRTFSVHKLVMLTFVGDKPEGCEINHIDGDKENNTLSNLEYVDHLNNMRHAFTSGLVKPISSVGESNVKAKLTKEQVLQIRQEYATGKVTQDCLAEKYSVYQTTISSIILGKIWKDL